MLTIPSHDFIAGQYVKIKEKVLHLHVHRDGNSQEVHILEFVIWDLTKCLESKSVVGT